MKNSYILTAVIGAALFCGCSDFLSRTPLTQPTNETYLSSESQLYSYVDGLYIALPALKQYGSGVRSEEKNSDNIISEKYDPRINGEYTSFSGSTEWSVAYQNLRDVNYFFAYYMLPENLENAATRSLYGECLFLRAWWHFSLLKNFGSVPVMDGFWDGNATIAGLQIAPRPRKDVARFILEDLERAVQLLHPREVFSGLRISREAALILAMNVALYEGSWEKYHAGTPFGAVGAQPEWFFGKVLEYGDELFEMTPPSEGLNTVETDPFGAKDGGEAFAHLFNQKDLSAVPEAVFWKKYDVAQGVQHSLVPLLASGIVDNEAAAGLSKSLADNYLYADGTFINPEDSRFRDFNETFSGRDPRMSETIMSTGHKFRSVSMTRPMRVAEYRYDGEEPSEEVTAHNESINPPRFGGDGNSRNITGYHIALGVDTTYTSSTFWDTGLVIVRYPEALLAYAEAAEELGRCSSEVLEMTIGSLRDRAGVEWVEPQSDPNFTDYGYELTPAMQEIRRERRTELALQGFRLDDILRWRGHEVLVGKRGRGAYFGVDGVLYKSFNREDEAVMEVISSVKVDNEGWTDPLKDRLPSGYAFRPDRDYLLPIPPEDISMNSLIRQNPNW